MASISKYVSNALKSALSSFSPNKVVAYTQRQYDAEYQDCSVLCCQKPHFYFFKVANHFEMTYIPNKHNEDELTYAFSLFRYQGDEPSGVTVYRRYVEVLGPLHYARVSLNLPCDRLLIEKITTLCREQYTWSASHIAAALSWLEIFQSSTIQSLLNDYDSSSGMTPLRIVIAAKDIRLLDYLLSLPNLDLTGVDEHGDTVVHLAAKQGSGQLLTALLARINEQTYINAMNSSGESALHIACRAPSRDCVEPLLNAGSNPLIGTCDLPLHLVVVADSIECVDLIYQHCPQSLNCPRQFDLAYPIHLATNFKMLQHLCELGADLDAQDASGLSVLHTHVMNNDLDAVLYLLARGANPNLGDSEGSTPLHYAVISHASVHILRALLIFEADCSVVDIQQRSPRHLLCTEDEDYTHSDGKDLALYTLHAVGAKRCSAAMEGCTIGCMAPEVAEQNHLVLFDGTAPAVTHHPSDDAANLFEEIFSSVTTQQIQQPSSSPLVRHRLSRCSMNSRHTLKSTHTDTDLFGHHSLSPLSTNASSSTLNFESQLSSPNKVTRRRQRRLSHNSSQPCSRRSSVSSCHFTLEGDVEERPIRFVQPCGRSNKKRLIRPDDTHQSTAQLHFTPRACQCEESFLKELLAFDRRSSAEQTGSNTTVLAPDSTAHQSSTDIPQLFCTTTSISDISDSDDDFSVYHSEEANHPRASSKSAPSGPVRVGRTRSFNLRNTVDHRSQKPLSKWNCGPRGYRMLSLDGGGVRGLILVQTLRAVERVSGKPVTELFDWLIGTSTGGILALLLLRGKCLRCCRQLLFNFKDSVFFGKRPYPAEQLEKIIRRELGEHTKMTDLKRIRVAITTLVSDRCPPVFHMFRNYTSPRVRMHKLLQNRTTQQESIHCSTSKNNTCSVKNNVGANNTGAQMKRSYSITTSSSVFDFLMNASGFRTAGDTTNSASPVENDTDQSFDPITPDSEQLVWKAARATGAAPTYFRPCGRFLDGGLISNNPTLDMLTELQEIHMVQQLKDKPVTPLAVVVSLGTGRMPVEAIETVDVFRPQSLIETFRSAMGFSSLGRIIVEVATMSEGPVVDRASAWCASLGTPYFRFSPRLSLHVTLDTTDVRMLLQMVWETEAYLYRARDRLKDLVSMLL